MTITRLITLLGAIALAGSIWWAMQADGRALGDVLSSMFAQPWTVVTLIDLYLGFIICAVLVVLVEKNRFVALFWAAPIFVLGNVWTAIWFVIRLPAIARRLRSAD